MADAVAVGDAHLAQSVHAGPVVGGISQMPQAQASPGLQLMLSVQAAPTSTGTTQVPVPPSREAPWQFSPGAHIAFGTAGSLRTLKAFERHGSPAIFARCSAGTWRVQVAYSGVPSAAPHRTSTQSFGEVR